MPLLLIDSYTALSNSQSPYQSMALFDQDRQRSIPIELYFPENISTCAPQRLCQVALLSPGYGVSKLDYSFIAQDLTKLGYLVIAIQNQLPTDLPLASTGNIVKDRTPNWQQGTKNIHYVVKYLQPTFSGFDWQHLTLIGHSNGGDISALFASERNAPVGTVITLDNRRVSLPRDSAIKVLSIRASDFKADDGVLPSPEEAQRYGMCIVSIKGAHHNDMQDAGSVELKGRILRAIDIFLRQENNRLSYLCDGDSSID